MKDDLASRSVVGMIVCLLLLSAAVAWPSAMIAEESAVELLWPAGAPNAQGDAEGDRPTLAVHLPPRDKPSAALVPAIVVCPGGGYGGLAMGHEGTDVARWLNAHGIAAFILSSA